VSVPFDSVNGGPPERFNSPQVLSAAQSLLSTISAFIYLVLRRPKGASLAQILGLAPPSSGTNSGKTTPTTKNGHAGPVKTSTSTAARTLLSRYVQCAVSITAAAPFGFAALQHVSYPAMVLAKSCKLVPVMLMNVVLYRRAFAPHKYLVVSLVTFGITLFMFFGDAKHTKNKKSTIEHPDARHAALGMAYLLINLALDGMTNSTQDEVFARAPWPVSGQQMMFWINAASTALTLAISAAPLPHIPVLHPGPAGKPELAAAIAFARSHPGVLQPLVAFAACGAVGQLFIFETLAHFGSLTLV
jgi:solute carrier family 35 (UDP-galactose transporter), member B1